MGTERVGGKHGREQTWSPEEPRKPKGHSMKIKDKKGRKDKELRRGGARRPKLKGDFTQTEISLTVTHPDQACLQKSQFGSLERGEDKSQRFRLEH